MGDATDPTAWIRPIDPAVDLDWDEEPRCQHNKCDGERAYWVVGWKKGRALRAGGNVDKLACDRHAKIFCKARRIDRPAELTRALELHRYG
jgi:hypothetical protein